MVDLFIKYYFQMVIWLQTNQAKKDLHFRSAGCLMPTHTLQELPHTLCCAWYSLNIGGKSLRPSVQNCNNTTIQYFFFCRMVFKLLSYMFLKKPVKLGISTIPTTESQYTTVRHVQAVCRTGPRAAAWCDVTTLLRH